MATIIGLVLAAGPGTDTRGSSSPVASIVGVAIIAVIGAGVLLDRSRK